MTTTKRSAITILDLTVAQTEEIEMDIGLPMNKWGEAPSLARLLTAILAAVEGNDRSFYAGLTMSDLADRVTLGEPDPEA